MADFKGIVYLTEDQYLELKTNGTITVGETTLNFDENTLYVTDDEIENSVKDLNNSIANLIEETNSKSEVIVNNEHADTVNFDSDPQVQISQLSNPNLLINGDFRINQRGKTSYTMVNSYTVDRWLNREASLSVTPQTNGGVKLERTSNVIGDVPMISQSIENWKNLLGQTVTLTIKVSQDNASSGFLFGIYGAYQSRYASKAYIESQYLHGAGIYKLTTTLPETTDYTKMNFVIRLHKTDAVQGENIVVDWAKLEIGSISTPFIPRPYAEELALCQRYYIRLKSDTGYGAIGAGFFYSSARAFIIVNLPVTLRTKPTCLQDGARRILTADNYYEYSTLIVDSTSPQALSVVLDGSGYPKGQGCGLYLYADTSAYIDFDAEIYS